MEPLVPTGLSTTSALVTGALLLLRQERGRGLFLSPFLHEVAMPVGPHTFNQGAWHFCMRCERKAKLDSMTWQRGILLCSTCKDPYPLEGQREQAISQVLSDGKVDFQINSKLTDPVSDDDMLFF